MSPTRDKVITNVLLSTMNRRMLVNAGIVGGSIAGLGAANAVLGQSTGATPDDEMGGTPLMEGTPDMEGGMLGGSAQTETLAEAQVEQLPDEPLAWVAYAAAPEQSLTHRHAPGFVYAEDEEHAVTIDGQEIMLQPGEAVFVGQDVEHTHVTGSFWDILLTAPDAEPPSGLEDAEQVFASVPLEGIPEPPVTISFIRVELPPGSQTSIHTHPGSEFIYETEGAIDYQNAIIGTERTEAGGTHMLPRDTAVQKRNPEGETAVFLSWFIVDPDMPFAPEASFDEATPMSGTPIAAEGQ